MNRSGDLSFLMRILIWIVTLGILITAVIFLMRRFS